MARASDTIALGTALAIGVLGGLGQWATDQVAAEVKTWSVQSLDLFSQAAAVLTAFLVLYAIVQFTKRETAPVESWVPALFAVPCLCIFGGFLAAYYAAQSGTAGMPFTEILFINAWFLVFGMLAGTPALLVWIRAGQAAAQNEPHDLGATLLALQSQFRQILVVRGTKLQAVLVGMQVVLPGIFYALQLAFAEIIAVLKPEQSALRRSGQLTWGMRGRIFRLLALAFVVSNVLAIATLIAVGTATGEGSMSEQFGTLTQAWMTNPGSLGITLLVVQEVVASFVWWVTILAVLVLYNERERQVTATRELKRLLAQKDAPDENPYSPPQ
ncbi:MAG: hypothetical protein AAGA48_17815 [Myxococcota bacterium]